MYDISSARSRKLTIASKDFRVDNSFSTQASDCSSRSRKDSSQGPLDSPNVEFESRVRLESEPSSSPLKDQLQPKGPRSRGTRDNQSIIAMILRQNSLFIDSKQSRPTVQHRQDNAVTKFKTELCKNFELRGFCQWGTAVD